MPKDSAKRTPYEEAEARIAAAIKQKGIRLELSGFGLKALPETIGKLVNLQTLYLHNNQLSALPEALGKLTNLEQLYLGDNQLSTLPEWLGNLANLLTLSL